MSFVPVDAVLSSLDQGDAVGPDVVVRLCVRHDGVRVPVEIGRVYHVIGHPVQLPPLLVHGQSDRVSEIVFIPSNVQPEILKHASEQLRLGPHRNRPEG